MAIPSRQIGCVHGPQGPAGIQANLSAVSTDILPSLDNTWNLGSTSSRWNYLILVQLIAASAFISARATWRSGSRVSAT